MKSLILATISILASVQLCSADLFEKFIGTWSHVGQGSGVRITTVYERFEKRGLTATTKVVVTGMPKSVSVTRFYDNGKVKGVVRRNGAVQSKLTGTWKVSGKSLKAKTVVSAPMLPKFSQDITSTLVTGNKIYSLSDASNGVRSSDKLVRNP